MERGFIFLVLGCLGVLSGATSGRDCSLAGSEDDELSTLQLKQNPQPCSNSDYVVCEEPFAFCGYAKCIVSAFNADLPSGLKGMSLAYCNCSYMGATTSATNKDFTSLSDPAAYTNKPFENVCEYMSELPTNGYVLSTFTDVSLQPSWPVEPENTAAWLCMSENTVGANCDGAVCQVMDSATWTPKSDQSTWVPGDPAVCTCPLVQGAGQIMVGTVKDSECFSPGYPGGPGCVPSFTAGSRNSYEVMVGGVAGLHGSKAGPSKAGLIKNCTGKEPVALGPPRVCRAE